MAEGRIEGIEGSEACHAGRLVADERDQGCGRRALVEAVPVEAFDLRARAARLDGPIAEMPVDRPVEKVRALAEIGNDRGGAESWVMEAGAPEKGRRRNPSRASRRRPSS